MVTDSIHHRKDPKEDVILSDKLVSLCKIKQGRVTESIRRAIHLLGDPEDILPNEGETILVKPNIGWNSPWRTGTTTSPHFVRAIIDLLKARNPHRIIVGESPSIGMTCEDVFKSTGFSELEEGGIELRDLGKDKTIRVKLKKGSLLEAVSLPESYVSADFFINVPVVKTHVNTCVTLSTKNLKGLLPSREKRRFHLLGLDRCIAELSSVIRHGLIVVDGEVAQEGLGPISGDPVKLGAVIAGTNPLAVDTTCIRLMGIPLSFVDHLRIALEMGLGPTPDDVVVVGDPLETMSRRFRMPPRDLSSAYEGVMIAQGNPCSGCVGALTVSLERMAKAGELRQIREKLGCVHMAIGPRAQIPEEPQSEWVIVGNCLKAHASRGIYVPGCSPQGWYVRDIMRSLIGLPPLFADSPLQTESDND